MRVLSLMLALFLSVAACDSGPTLADPGDLVITETADGYLLQTEDEFACGGPRLEIETRVRADLVRVQVEGVIEPYNQAIVCTPGPIAALAPYPPSPGANPTHTVRIEKGDLVDTFRATCGVAGCSFGAAGPLTFSRLGPR